MDGFKQRIIGAFIIVCLAVIFLPMMFDEPHQERTRESIDLPDKPDFPSVRVDSPEAPPADTEREPVPAPETADTAAPSQQPPSDPVETLPQQEPDSAQAQGRDDTPSQETAATDNESGTATSPDSAALEGSYLVQLGSFGNADNARALRDRVRESGMQAYTESFQRQDDTLNRVFAGPFVSRDKAKQAKQSLDEAFGLDTLVISAGDND
ncbi:MAG: SPOR domain-containing protein [Oleiphilaceae bacterium]|nr:SPOR domain-containing protein [Oleiphilaceae bacterium]